MSVDEEALLAAFQKIQAKVDPPVLREDPTEELTDAVVVDTHVEPVRVHIDNKVTQANIFRHPDAHPVILDMLLLKKYGIEWMTWEPETVAMRIPGDFKVGEVSELALSKLMAMKTLHFVDTFWQQWEIFIWCIMPFNSVMPDFQSLQVPTVAQCLVGLDIAARVRTDVPYNDELKAFLGCVYKHDGILCTEDMGSIATLDHTPYAVDIANVHSRWSKVKESRKAPTGESFEDEQLRRLLAADDYLEESRTRLYHQTPLVRHV